MDAFVVLEAARTERRCLSVAIFRSLVATAVSQSKFRSLILSFSRSLRISSMSCWTVLRVFNEREREPAKNITSKVIHILLPNRNIKTYRKFCLEMETLQTRSARPNPRRAWTWCNWMLRWGSKGACRCCLVSILQQLDPSMVMWLPISLIGIYWKKRERIEGVKYRISTLTQWMFCWYCAPYKHDSGR